MPGPKVFQIYIWLICYFAQNIFILFLNFIYNISNLFIYFHSGRKILHTYAILEIVFQNPSCRCLLDVVACFTAVVEQITLDYSAMLLHSHLCFSCLIPEYSHAIRAGQNNFHLPIHNRRSCGSLCHLRLAVAGCLPFGIQPGRLLGT